MANIQAVIGRHKPVIEQFQFGPWTLTGSKSHILVSEGPDRENFESHLKLPHVPEMIYDKNLLRLEHVSGFNIEFNALDALKLVDAEHDIFKVADADEWLQARADCEFVKHHAKPFDWTFSTEYNGTINDPKGVLKISETEERINIEKLKNHERIHFFQDIILFEDELSDNGDSNINVKIRVMPTSFFLLLRQYMRVDRVIVRINDTRVYHEAGWNYMIRETSTREALLKNCNLSLHMINDKNEVWQHIPIKKEIVEKIEFPAEVTS